MTRAQRPTSLPVISHLAWVFCLGISICSQSNLCAQFSDPILLTDGIDTVSDAQINLDTSCSSCSPQQVSLCARTSDQIHFSGTLLQFQTMISALDSANEVGSPALTQGFAAHYLITLDEGMAAGPRTIYLIESYATGFGDPEQISSGADDCHDSDIEILDSGHRVISWTCSNASGDTVWMKYGETPPVEVGPGASSQVLSVGGETTLIVWLDGTVLRARQVDTGSMGMAFVLYDMLNVPLHWGIESDASANLQIVALVDDQLLLLEGSTSGGITSQQVISNRGTGTSHLSFSSLSQQRYCISWIQDGMLQRHSLRPDGTISTDALDFIEGDPQEVEVAIDAAGNEHFMVISDGEAWYTHDTPAPTADFVITSDDDGIADHTISFHSDSAGMISSHLWDFGDGEFSSMPQGEHTYVEPGTFIISLTVTGPGGTDTMVSSGPIEVALPASSMALADIEVFAGQPVYHPVLGTHDNFLQGYQIALRYDATILEMEAISLTGTMAQALLPEFFITQINPAGIDSTMYLAVIFDTLPPFDGRMMDPGTNQTLCTLDYTVQFGTPMGTSTQMSFTDGVGDPPINTIYAIEGGLSEAPYLIHGTVTISQQPQFLFVRGDANYNQSVNIADAIFLLDYLFIGGVASVCPDAADSNDDGSLNIGDAINLLNFLFSNGETIPYPYPGYGIDPTPDGLAGCLP
jgi:PKD repeat protein